MKPLLFRGPPSKRPTRILRELLETPGIIVAPGVFNPATALLAEKMGFKALYISGAAITGSLAMPDLGLITLDELLLHVRWISRVTSLPLIVDVDTGFGEAINVMRTVRLMEEAGAAAIQIEDQVLPKKCGHLSGKQLVSAEDMAKKIRAAAEARSDENFMIIARTDARGVEGFEEAVRRAHIYLEAGADVIFPEALTSREEFERFAREVKAPLLANMTEFGKTPYITVREFEDMGYKIVIFPVTTFRVAMGAIRKALSEILEKGTQKGLLGEMMTRQEFYQLIGYWEYEEFDRRIDSGVKELFSKNHNKK